MATKSKVLASLNEMVVDELEREGELRRPQAPTIKDIIRKGADGGWSEGDLNIAMENAGLTNMWNVKTREHSYVLVRNLKEQLGKKNEDGTAVFTTVQPKIPPMRGKELCMLHEDHPDRKFFDSLGLRTCTKDNLINFNEVQIHLQRRHKSAWNAIKADNEKKEKEEARQTQMQLVEALKGMKSG